MGTQLFSSLSSSMCEVTAEFFRNPSEHGASSLDGTANDVRLTGQTGNATVSSNNQRNSRKNS